MNTLMKTKHHLLWKYTKYSRDENGINTVFVYEWNNYIENITPTYDFMYLVYIAVHICMCYAHTRCAEHHTELHIPKQKTSSYENSSKIWQL